MRGENFTGQKINVNFFLAMARNLHILARNLYNLVKICSLWREETGPGKKKIGVTTRRCVPARRIYEFFLARICAAKDIDKTPGLSANLANLYRYIGKFC